MKQIQAQELNPQYLAYSPETTSEITSISITSLYRDRQTGCMGGIPFVQIGNRIVYPVALVEEWLLKNARVGIYSKSKICNEHSDVKRQRGRPKGTTKVAIAAQRNQFRLHLEAESHEVGQ